MNPYESKQTPVAAAENLIARFNGSAAAAAPVAELFASGRWLKKDLARAATLDEAVFRGGTLEQKKCAGFRLVCRCFTGGAFEKGKSYARELDQSDLLDLEKKFIGEGNADAQAAVVELVLERRRGFSEKEYADKVLWLARHWWSSKQYAKYSDLVLKVDVHILTQEMLLYRARCHYRDGKWLEAANCLELAHSREGKADKKSDILYALLDCLAKIKDGKKFLAVLDLLPEPTSASTPKPLPISMIPNQCLDFAIAALRARKASDSRFYDLCTAVCKMGGREPRVKNCAKDLEEWYKSQGDVGKTLKWAKDAGDGYTEKQIEEAAKKRREWDNARNACFFVAVLASPLIALTLRFCVFSTDKFFQGATLILYLLWLIGLGIVTSMGVKRGRVHGRDGFGGEDAKHLVLIFVVASILVNSLLPQEARTFMLPAEAAWFSFVVLVLGTSICAEFSGRLGAFLGGRLGRHHFIAAAAAFFMTWVSGDQVVWLAFFPIAWGLKRILN